MQTAAAVESGCPDFVNIGSSIKKAFCPKEETGASSFIKGQAQSAHERVDRMIALGTAVLEVTRPAFPAEPVVNRDSLKERRFARAVFACKEADARTQVQFLETADCRNREGVVFPVLHSVAQELDLFQHCNWT